ncbi:hypothetical protein SAMD00023353_12200030 [Rosellinia necatrix]|uniref:Uncharacterized protein n=1 Tax=Rosellinia necatrix TaxID=77044 RepID=A0A1W2TXI9_ROSNE|nr:hypothetical protein SAMD00023353_12200030 [Rosellinia necatrix]
MACISFNAVTARLQRLIGLKSKAAAAAANEKRHSHAIQISAPFNFKHESISLPGLSEDDIAHLKEKAAASRLGSVASANDNDVPSAFSSPRKAPRAPHSPVRNMSPVVTVTPGTPLPLSSNVI